MDFTTYPTTVQSCSKSPKPVSVLLMRYRRQQLSDQINVSKNWLTAVHNDELLCADSICAHSTTLRTTHIHTPTAHTWYIHLVRNVQIISFVCHSEMFSRIYNLRAQSFLSAQWMEEKTGTTFDLIVINCGFTLASMCLLNRVKWFHLKTIFYTV